MHQCVKVQSPKSKVQKSVKNSRFDVRNMTQITNTTCVTVKFKCLASSVLKLVQRSFGETFANGLFDAGFLFGTQEAAIDAALDGVKQL